MKDISKLIRPNIASLTPYSTARDDFKGGEISVWLDANESPYDNGVNRYPDPHQKALKAKLARLKGTNPENIFVGGAGSDEAIDLVYRIFCNPGEDNVVAINPSYGVYAVAAAINDIEYREVDLGDNFGLPVSELLDAADSHTKIIWICSPNNPTANAFDKQDILEIARRFNGIVVVDEAYVDFSDKGSVIGNINEYSNLIVLQTLSKAWGMASLRLGMAFADKAIIRLMSMVKYPYNVNGPTQKEVMRRIQTPIDSQVNEISEQRAYMARQLLILPAVKKVFPSDANFMLVRFDNPNAVYDYLVSNGVIVRNRSKLTGCEGCLRITVGTPEENKKVIELIRRFSV